MTSWKLPRSYRLRSRKQIQYLFKKNQSYSIYPIRLVYVLHPLESDVQQKFKVAFSCSKKRFKRAVDRNRIKRLMREAFRLRQHELTEVAEHQYQIMFIYTGKEILEFSAIDRRIGQLIRKLNRQ